MNYIPYQAMPSSFQPSRTRMTNNAKTFYFSSSLFLPLFNATGRRPVCFQKWSLDSTTALDSLSLAKCPCTDFSKLVPTLREIMRPLGPFSGPFLQLILNILQDPGKLAAHKVRLICLLRERICNSKIKAFAGHSPGTFFIHEMIFPFTFAI